MLPRTFPQLGLACLLACSASLSDPPQQSDASPAPRASARAGAGAGSDSPIFGEPQESLDARRQLTGDGCAELTAGTEVLPAVLQLLVDTSGSMNDEAPGGSRSKWDVTRDALLAAVERIPAEAALGVSFYPNVAQNAQPCYDPQTAVPIGLLGAPSSGQRQAITRAFEGVLPQGGTPTHDAYQFALSQLQASPALGRRFVVLITDGVPTFSLGCVGGRGFGRFQQPVDAAPLIAEAATAQADELSTFVIGSPGSEDGRESLSRLAEAAGTARPGCSHQGLNYCHFDMTTQSDLGAGLADALRTITGTALSCDYPLPAPPPGAVLDLDLVNLTLAAAAGGEEQLPRSTGAQCTEGWQYADDQTRVVLCPSTCERVRSSRGQVTLRVGCATVLR
jgi:hypothetical protein